MFPPLTYTAAAVLLQGTLQKRDDWVFQGVDCSNLIAQNIRVA